MARSRSRFASVVCALAPGFLCFARRTPPRGRGNMRGLWFSRRHGRVCWLPPEGKPGTSILSRAATAVLGVLGLLGRALETVLAVVKGLCRGYTQPRLQDGELPVFARHEYRAWARDKRAARVVAR
jgi:hypothetical protein